MDTSERSVDGMVTVVVLKTATLGVKRRPQCWILIPKVLLQAHDLEKGNTTGRKSSWSELTASAAH